MASNINPSLTPVNNLANFRFWCQKVLPLVYDDSLSYYEVLGKMVVQLNDVIDNVNADTENVLTLKDAFLALQTYVNNFFDDIDQLASYAERAEAAQTAANTSAVNAATSASNASASSLAAMDARDTAVAARQAAQASANTASTAATNANTKANEAAQSAITAQTAQASASQSATLAATDRSAAQTAASTATTKASEASTSATNAETSANNAAQSKEDAEEAANNIQENLDNIQKNTQDISDLKESLNEYYSVITKSDWAQGAFNTASGISTNTNNAIRNSVPTGTVKIHCPTDYKFNIWAYNKADSSYVGHLASDGTFKKGTSYLFLTDYEIDSSIDYIYRITFYNSDNSIAIAPAAGVNCQFTLTTDTTLTQLGKPADAKTTGDKINEINAAVMRNIRVAENPTFGTPATIFENDDEYAISNVDDGLLNFVSVLKISDSMYYMYYEGYGINGGTNYSDINLCFAYSTDGQTFIKGFPSGVEAPIANSNVLLPKGSTHGQCVVKVPDGDFPYRMVCVLGTDPNRIVQMWKSADAVHWSLIRSITSGYNDSPVSCVVRGSLLKIFIRTRNTGRRAVSVIVTDLDGNRYNSALDNQFFLEEANPQIYTSSASILDDKREILFPTLYNESDYTQDIGCFILDGENLQRKALTTTGIIPADVKSIYFGSGLVDIGLKTFAFYATRNADHESFVMGTTKSAIRRVEVTTSM